MSEEELFLQQIGQRIMERRKNLGLTQEALAEKGDVTTQFVSYAEAGKRAIHRKISRPALSAKRLIDLFYLVL